MRGKSFSRLYFHGEIQIDMGWVGLRSSRKVKSDGCYSQICKLIGASSQGSDWKRQIVVFMI